MKAAIIIPEPAIFKAKTREWFEDLKGLHEGLPGVLLATGPSLADLSDEELSSICRDRVVFAVKQALVRYPRANYHCFNPVHLIAYEYQEPRPTVFGQSWMPGHILPVDYQFGAVDAGSIKKALVNTCEWDRSLFTFQHRRPWGPGILYEVVLPLAIHLGIGNLIAVGWDFNEPGSRACPHAIYIPHPVVLPDWEVAAHIASSESYYRWLLSYGIELTLLSTHSYLSEAIPRVTLEEVL